VQPTIRGLAAALTTALLLAACGGDHPARGTAASTTTSSNATATSAGLATRPPDEIARAAYDAYRSARSVHARVQARQGAGADAPGPMDLTLTRDGAQGWIAQPGGVRMNVISTGGSIYVRGREFWARQGGADLARRFDDRWVLFASAGSPQAAPFAKYLTIDGFAQFLALLRTPFDAGGRSTASVAGVPVVRLRSSLGTCDVAATGKPYPLRVDLGDQGRIELSGYDRQVAIQAPPGALRVG
jgi:hypothetical protein